MKDNAPVIRVKEGFAWFTHGLRIAKCVLLDENDTPIAGSGWLKEIVKSGETQTLMVIRNAEFDGYRKDADEDWQPPQP